MQISKEKIERELEEKVEVLALTRQVEDCKRQLISLLNIWYRYQTEIKQKLMFEYDALFGSLEDEIYDKNWIETHKNNLRQTAIEATRRIMKNRQLINKIKIEK